MRYPARMFALLVACVSPDSETDPVTGADPAPLGATVLSSRGLSELGEAAVAAVPAWLRHDLALSLAQQREVEQDTLATLILDLDDPNLVDEVAFTVAHLSPEVLADKDFHPEVLELNARLLYARDADLDYVRIEDVGTPGVDEDAYTHAIYQVEVDGVVEEHAIDADTWYWYVVHPRIEDERPYYVDPWAACPNYGTQCPVAPDQGTFWREYLWDGAAESCPEGLTCPVLADAMVGQTVLWKSHGGTADNGAIEAITGFLHAAMDFGALSERSIQPVRIYGLAHGNCGEWADITAASARTALIPTINVGAMANDHTWNEFWDGDWQQWEPVNGWALHTTYYVDGDHQTPTESNNKVYAVSATRGDAAHWSRTATYGNPFTLRVSVVDKNGVPVDGAAVSAWGPMTVYGYDDYFVPALEGYTGLDGVVDLEVGELNVYAAFVTHPIGESGRQEQIVVAEPVEAGSVVEVAMKAKGDVADVAPRPAVSVLDVGAPDTEVPFTVEIAGWRTLASSQLLGDTSSVAAPTGTLVAYLVDDDNLAALQDGAAFEAEWAQDLATPSGTVALVGDAPRVLVLHNPTTATAALGTLTLTLDGGPVSVPFELRGGQRLEIELAR